MFPDNTPETPYFPLYLIITQRLLIIFHSWDYLVNVMSNDCTTSVLFIPTKCTSEKEQILREKSNFILFVLLLSRCRLKGFSLWTNAWKLLIDCHVMFPLPGLNALHNTSGSVTDSKTMILWTCRLERKNEKWINNVCNLTLAPSQTSSSMQPARENAKSKDLRGARNGNCSNPT